MSQLTLADVINASISYLEQPIISATTLKKITNFSRLIPATSTIGFEYRLTQPNTEVDFFIRGSKKDGGDRILAACDPSNSPQNKLYASPLWQRVKKFSQLWLKQDLPLHKSVEHIWLEMDNQELDKEQPAPCLFFEISRDANKNPEWITDLALPILYEKSVAKSTKNQLINCINNLPKYSHLAYVGTMLSRPDSPIRLCIKMEIKDVKNYLKTIGWNYNFSQIDKALDNLIQDFAEMVVIALDVKDRIMPRVGFEYKPAFTTKGWDFILDRLVENKLCLATERDAFLSWQHEPQELQDKELRRHFTLMPPKQLALDNLPLIIRRLNHVKIDCYPESVMKAKLYYALIYLYRNINQ